jgi:long-chain acyl-CoA synthetase
MVRINRIFDLLQHYDEKFSDLQFALASKVNGEWKSYSSQQYIELANTLSLGLLELGIEKGDKIATIINNCPEWNFFDMAIMQIGAIQVPIYPTISLANYEYIFKEAQVKYIIVSNKDIYKRIESTLSSIPTLIKVFSIEKTDKANHWTEIINLGKQNISVNLETIKSGISPYDLATIIYTSGTTGNPKGVMISHSNFVSNFMACSDILSKHPVNKSLSLLPLCHVYERMLNYVYQYNGVSVYYAESIDKFRDNLKEVKPEFFCAVPRVIEKTYAKLVRTGRGLKGIKKQLFFWALNLAHRFEFDDRNGLFYEFQRRWADRLVYRKWRQAFGGELKVIVTGGASLNPMLSRTFWCAKIKIMEGYGLTETSPVVAVSNFERGGVHFGTVGKKLPGVEIKLADDGEILCKSPGLMMGYYRQPELTKEVIDAEGWFHTGDIGEWVDGVYLKITDRKKEIFKNSGGKYISPQVVENAFRESPFIENIIVIGENKNFTTALLVPNFEHVESWCQVKNHPFTTAENAIRDERIVKRIQKEIDLINNQLDKTEQVNKFRLLASNWNIESGELSPTMKLRRKVILEENKALIDAMYDGAGLV